MSEDLKKAASGKKSAHKAVTSTPALILVMLVEFVMFAFYPFLFLVIIPYSKYEPYPENFCEYHNDTKEVVLTTDRYILSYIDWETKEQGDGSNILFIPAGSTIEVSRVNMHDYPEAPAYIGISFYYDENGKGYTLWDNISLLCIENPEEIFNDLDAIRAAEKQNNESVRTKTITGFVITIVAASVAVLVLYLFLKKNLARHVVAASILVLIVYVLLFTVGQIAANIYYDVIFERLGL